MKKLLICLTVLFSTFLFTNSVMAYTTSDTFNFELPSSKNKFNSSTVTKGKYLKLDGSLHTNSDWSLSDYIPVEPNQQYTISGTTITGGTPISLGFYDINKNLIGTLEHLDYVPPKTITIPEDCYYIRDSMYNGDISTYQIEKGTVATDYIKYYDDTQTIFNYNNTTYTYNVLYSEYLDSGVIVFTLYSFSKEPYVKKVDDYYTLYTNSEGSKWQYTLWSTNDNSWYYNQDSVVSRSDYNVTSKIYNTQYSKLISADFDLKDNQGNIVNFESKLNFNITLHLNGGIAWDTNEICDDMGCYIVGNKYEDYTISVPGNNLISYLRNVYVTKEPMQFVGWYYDEKLTQKVESTDTIDSDQHFYAKYQYKNVEDFLNNTTFNSYTFDENYQYAVISLNDQSNRDIYLGLDIFATNLEVYKYDKINNSTIKGSTSCLTPIYSKEDKYYYQVSDSLDDTYEVLILEKEKLKENYNFLLSNNAYVTYTNDLKNLVIKDDNGNDLTIDIEDSYNYSQDNLLNSENDLLEIFKDLINNKDNNIFSYFNQVWNLMKQNKLFTYFMCLIIGSLIILIIKAASR